MKEEIYVKGAKENNLKNVDVHIPRGTLTVFTGVSGSGKSTLAFDTIFAEGQRRYMESLSSYARQFLGMMEKPDVESIDGLSPAISIDQKTTSHNPRSTVGTVTEIYDYLRLLFARVGVPHCPKCGREIRRQTVDEIADRVMELPAGSRVAVIGSSFAGNIIAQVLQYHKLIPIVIDNSPAALEKARSCGIYYCYAADDDLNENINEATSGQLCDASVYTTCSRIDPALTMRVLADGKCAVLAGFAPINFNIPARELCDKNTSLTCAMNGYGYTDTAINLLVHKAVNFSVFEKEILTEFDPNAVYKSMADVTAVRRGKMTIFKMII